MRYRAKRCASVVLAIAVPLFPAVGTPSGSLAQSSRPAPFLETLEAIRAARLLDPVSRTSAHPVQPPRLDAKEAPKAAVGPFVASAAGVSQAGSLSGSRAPMTITVEQGQNPWRIALTHGVSLEALLDANGLRPGEAIRVGQHLEIPQADAGAGSVITRSASPAVVAPPGAQRLPMGTGHHVIDEGESLWSIAQRYHISVAALTDANGLTEQSLIYPGRKLVIPTPGTPLSATRTPAPKAATPAPTPATTVVVQPGQTLWSISRAHGVSVEAIVSANQLSSAELVRAGQRVTIPGTTASYPRHGTLLAPEPAPPTHRVVDGLLWPARGVMTSGFGWRRSHHHNGIDISANRGDPIMAAMAGTVIFAGWYGGYGLAVIIDHGGGLLTIYGHASKILVHSGEEVASGQTVARVGCTGVCTGPHLHFEIRIEGRATNPLQYLP